MAPKFDPSTYKFYTKKVPCYARIHGPALCRIAWDHDPALCQHRD
jgi:hypothetical protein